MTELSHDSGANGARANGVSAIDIIILDWNRPDDTIAAIESALGQIDISAHVWVIDQASEPQNRERVMTFCAGKPNVSVRLLDRNVGPPEGRNIAIALGRAPIIVGLDNDAVFADPHCLARAVKLLDADAQIGLLAFRVLDPDTRQDQIWDYPERLRNQDVESFEATRFLAGGFAMRRTAFDKAGGFDGDLFFCGEERDLAWRIINTGYRIRWCRNLAVVHKALAPQKITWKRQRFYYTVRNTLYTNHKFGAGRIAFWRTAIAFLIRGFYNGLGWSAGKGILHAFPMIWRHSRASPSIKMRYSLSDDIHQYIIETDQKDGESFWSKLRRQLTPLPGFFISLVA
jgi:GT2 family glycosyltransferase